jgi:Fe2+ transport system protein FeoA
VGRTVTVIQHRPMTVLEVDQTEVALETELAELILVGGYAT